MNTDRFCCRSDSSTTVDQIEEPLLLILAVSGPGIASTFLGCCNDRWNPSVEGKLYLCSIKDVFSNRIVGYSIDSRETAELACSALRQAIARRQPKGTVVVHSDRGGQFRS